MAPLRRANAGNRMLKGLNLNRFPKSLVYVGLVTSVCASMSCGGSSIGGPYSAEFFYVATGTVVAQYGINIYGQIIPLSTATVPTTNAVALTLSKKGDFAYVVNKSDNLILQYSVPATGLLTALTTASITTDASPVAIAESNDGKFVYCLNSGANTITQYSVGTNGQLTALPTASVPVAADGVALAMAPNGGYLYAASYSSGKVSAFSIGTDGQLTPLATPTYDVNSPNNPTFSPDGKYLYVPSSTDGVAQFSVGTDGSLTPMTPATVAGPAAGNDAFAVSPDGKFGYLGSFNGGVANSPVGQYSIGGTGALTPLAPASVAAGNAPQYMAIEPQGKFLFVANGNDGTISQFSIGTDGTLTALSPATVNSSGALQIVIFAR